VITRPPFFEKRRAELLGKKQALQIISQRALVDTLNSRSGIFETSRRIIQFSAGFLTPGSPGILEVISAIAVTEI
jgi:hypothetical protein